MRAYKNIIGFARRWRLVRVFIILAPLLLFYLLFLNFTEPNELGISRNWFSGKMWVQRAGGWHLTAPWVSVAVINTSPIRVHVTSAGHGYSAKLVQFNPDEWQEFVQVEGFRYYWWANRISINFGYDEEYRGMRDIMRGYAFGSKQYKFIKILTEYQ